MNKDEAKKVLSQKMADYLKFSYEDLVEMTGTDEYFEIAGPSGAKYQIEIQIREDDTVSGNIRVMGAIDDGNLFSLTSYLPITQCNIFTPEGEIL